MLNNPTYQKHIAKLIKEMGDKATGKTGGQSMRALLSQGAKIIREQHAEIERLSQVKHLVSNRPKAGDESKTDVKANLIKKVKEPV